MKLLTCIYDNEACLGVLKDDQVCLPARDPKWQGARDMLSLIDAGPQALQDLGEILPDCPRVSMQAVQLLAPIPRPRQNVICLGWNYIDHMAETRAVRDGVKKVERPKNMIVFTKSAGSVCGPYDDIPLDPDISKRLDWEVELGVVIGRAGHKVPMDKALDYVFGYTVVNDISARDLQKRHSQFYLGKSLPKSCPIGPYIVTADEIADPQNLRLRSWVNDDLKQDAKTAEQVFGICEAVATISKSPAVECGDIIATGTPAGVGYARSPPEYLQHGDVVACEIENIGTLRNRVCLA